MESRLRNVDADLVQAACPRQVLSALKSDFRVGRFVDAFEKSERQLLHPCGLRLIDVIALRHRLDRRVANVFVLAATEQVVQHAIAQRRVGDGHARQLQLFEHREHDRQATRQDRHTVALDAGQNE